MKLDLPTFGKPQRISVLEIGFIEGRRARCCRTSSMYDKLSFCFFIIVQKLLVNKVIFCDMMAKRFITGYESAFIFKYLHYKSSHIEDHTSIEDIFILEYLHSKSSLLEDFTSVEGVSILEQTNVLLCCPFNIIMNIKLQPVM